MKKLEIDIKGASNTGKSTIAYLIKKTLMENGFDVTFNSVDFNTVKDFDEHMKPNFYKKLMTLPDKIKIKLNEIQIVDMGKISLPPKPPSDREIHISGKSRTKNK